MRWSPARGSVPLEPGARRRLPYDGRQPAGTLGPGGGEDWASRELEALTPGAVVSGLAATGVRNGLGQPHQPKAPEPVGPRASSMIKEDLVALRRDTPIPGGAVHYVVAYTLSGPETRYEQVTEYAPEEMDRAKRLVTAERSGIAREERTWTAPGGCLPRSCWSSLSTTACSATVQPYWTWSPAGGAGAGLPGSSQPPESRATEPPATGPCGSSGPTAGPASGDISPDPNAGTTAAIYYPRDPRAPDRLAGTTHDIDLVIEERHMTVADGFVREVWTFGGTVPGPVIRVQVGDTIRVHLVNHPPALPGRAAWMHPAVNNLPPFRGFPRVDGRLE